MLYVLQIYRSAIIYRKKNYTAENRNIAESWPSTLESHIGFIEDNCLHLSEEYKQEEEIKNPFLLVIVDNIPVNRKDIYLEFIKDNFPVVNIFQQINKLMSVELFRIKYAGERSFDLSIDYSSHSMIIGLPERENHKMGELKPEIPLRYKINGKADFTLTGRKEREFYEFDYLFELKEVEKILFVAPNRAVKTKNIITDNCKLVNERKMLY